MGVDIHGFTEIKRNREWEVVQSVDEYIFPKTRNYSIFGFLAGVRNYSECPPISLPKGLPTDSEFLNKPSPYSLAKSPNDTSETNRQLIEENPNYHNYSYLTLAELLAFDYSQTFEDRSVSKQVIVDGHVRGINSATTAKPGEGNAITFREHLGPEYFKFLDKIKTLGDPENVRIVFWFD